MAKMKFKLDGAAIKQFFFEKGERVGLIACTLIMVLVVGYALWSGMSSRGTEKGEKWDVGITSASKRVQEAIQRATLNEEGPKNLPDVNKMKWFVVPYSGQFLPLFPLPDKSANKKLNPSILQIMTGDEDKLWQLNYYAAGVFVYNIDPASKKATVIFGGSDKGGGGAPGMVGKGGAQGGNLINVARNVRPTRMVVVSAIFPMRDQLDEYRKALRYATLEELLAHRDELPKPIGLEVSRSEALPDGKWSEWKPLFRIDRNGKPIVEPTIKDMMRRMLVDDEDPQLAAQYIYPGLVTPLPKLANAEYAKLDLKGFDVKAQVAAGNVEGPVRGQGFPKGPMMPGRGPVMPGKGPVMGKKGMEMGMDQKGPAGVGGDIRLRDEPWAKLTPDLKAKFEEKFNVFDPLAHPIATPEKKGNVGFNKGIGIGGQDNAGAGVFGWDLILGGAAGGNMGFPMGPANPMREGDMGDEGVKPGANNVHVNLGDALVRFFDPTVETGKTYCYSVRVRMANPNYNKQAEVEYQALAAKKELDWLPQPNPQGWVVSPAITIPGDYFFYATDQAPEVKIKGGAHSGPAPFSPETTPIQVHRWLGKVPDRSGPDWLTADWAIAERLHTRRGDPIGGHEVVIEMGTWNMPYQMFEIGISGRAARNLPKAPQPNKAEPIASGIPVDLIAAPAAVVVDFDGGKLTGFQRRDGGREFIQDTSAVELLVMMPDGKLVVRNSRIDSDPETPAGAERHDRFTFWRDRIAGLRSNRAPAGGEEAPMMPMRGN
jgi:hypothetical protein